MSQGKDRLMRTVRILVLAPHGTRTHNRLQLHMPEVKCLMMDFTFCNACRYSQNVKSAGEAARGCWHPRQRGYGQKSSSVLRRDPQRLSVDPDAKSDAKHDATCNERLCEDKEEYYPGRSLIDAVPASAIHRVAQESHNFHHESPR